MPPGVPHAPRRICLLMPALLLCIGAPAAAADWTAVAALHAAARYDDASALADSLALREVDLPVEALYWRAMLAATPADARAAIAAALEHPDLERPARDRLRLESAWLAYAAGDPGEALGLLDDLTDRRSGDVPGDAWLLAGMAARAAGDNERSREAFASIPPRDPEYAWARLNLALLAQAAGDAALARHYLDAARSAPSPVNLPDVLAAGWELDRAADPGRARDLRRELMTGHPRSLAAARVREQMAQAAADSLSAAGVGAAVAAPAAEIHPRRVALQLAAFADRGRALAYMDQWRDALPDLRLTPEEDDRGVLLYKIRSGSFVTRSQAEVQAERLRREHGLRVMLVETTDRP